jgi:hypothetical protein
MRNPLNTSCAIVFQRSVLRKSRIRRLTAAGGLLLHPMPDAVEQVNATTGSEPGNGIRISIDAGDHVARRIMSAGDKQSGLLDLVARIGAKLFHVDILRTIAIEWAAKSAAREVLCVIGDILAGEPRWQRVRVGQACQKRRSTGGSD